MKNTLLILGLMLMLVLTGCGGADVEPEDGVNNGDTAGGDNNVGNDAANGDNQTGDNNQTGENQAGNDAQQPTDNQQLKVGDTANINELLVTLKGIRTEKGTDEFDKPQKDFYLIVDVLIENKTNESQAISSLLNTKLYNAEGYEQEWGFLANTKGSLDGEVGPGRKMAGEMAFDVEQSEYFEFIFEDPFIGGQAIWKFTATD